MKYLASILILILGISLNSYTQPKKRGYRYVADIDARLERNLMANELFVDPNGNYLVVNFGHEPSYIVVIEIGTWKALHQFKLEKWIDFSGAYISHDKEELYILEERYSKNYYRFNLITGAQDMVDCEKTPNGCEVIEPKQQLNSVYSPDNKYYISIQKKTRRAVHVFEMK